MAVAGYSTTLQVSSDSTTLTNEACSVVTAGTKYQITAAAHRHLDPAVAIVVKDNGVVVGATLYTIDPLYGYITFSGYSATGPVTINGAAKNLVSLIDARSVSETLMSDLVDRTVFGTNAVKQRQATTQDYSAELSTLSTPLVDQDPGAAVQTLNALKANGTPVLLVITFPTDTNVFKAWCLVEEISDKGSPGALQEMTVKLKLAPQPLTGRTEQAGVGYSS